MSAIGTGNIQLDHCCGVSYEWRCQHCTFSTLVPTEERLVYAIRDHFRRDGGNVLLQQSSHDDHSQRACMRHLSTYDLAETGVLVVTKSPGERLTAWRREVGAWPQRLTILTPNMADTLPASDVVDEADFFDGPLAIEEIGSGGLDTVARAIDRELKKLAETTARVTVCIHTLTELLTSFGTQPVFKLVHALGGRVRNADAFAHWHYMPDTQIQSSNHIVRQPFQLLHETRDGANTLRQL